MAHIIIVIVIIIIIIIIMSSLRQGILEMEIKPCLVYCIKKTVLRKYAR